jgi:hypothetical protein
VLFVVVINEQLTLLLSGSFGSEKQYCLLFEGSINLLTLCVEIRVMGEYECECENIYDFQF